MSRKRAFRNDLATATGRDASLIDRVERRVVKPGDNPKHHGYHAGGRIRCNWVAGVGNWAIIYEIDEIEKTATLLRFVNLDDI